MEERTGEYYIIFAAQIKDKILINKEICVLVNILSPHIGILFKLSQNAPPKM